MDKNERDWVRDCPYPLTIISDRYTGTYSGGRFLAFNMDEFEIPGDISSDDCSCADFWFNFKGFVGKGETPDDALKDLITKLGTNGA